MKEITYEQAVEAKKILLAWIEQKNLGYDSIGEMMHHNRKEFLLYIALTSEYFLD